MKLSREKFDVLWEHELKEARKGLLSIRSKVSFGQSRTGSWNLLTPFSICYTPRNPIPERCIESCGPQLVATISKWGAIIKFCKLECIVLSLGKVLGRFKALPRIAFFLWMAAPHGWLSWEAKFLFLISNRDIINSIRRSQVH